MPKFRTVCGMELRAHHSRKNASTMRVVSTRFIVLIYYDGPKNMERLLLQVVWVKHLEHGHLRKTDMHSLRRL
jgi:hypothetical protein